MIMIQVNRFLRQTGYKTSYNVYYVQRIGYLLQSCKALNSIHFNGSFYCLYWKFAALDPFPFHGNDPKCF